MDERTDVRRPAAFAAGSALVVLGASLVPPPEELEEGVSGAAVRRYYESNQDAFGWLVVAQGVAFAAALVLVVALAALAYAHGARRGALTDLLLVAGGLTALAIGLQGALDLVPVVMLDDDGTLAPYDDQTLLALDPVLRLGETMGDLATVPRGLLLLTVSLLALRQGFLPRWVAWFGLVLAAACLVSVVGLGSGLAPFLVAFFVGLFGFFLWLLVLTVVLGMRALRPAPAIAPG